MIFTSSWDGQRFILLKRYPWPHRVGKKRRLGVGTATTVCVFGALIVTCA